MGRLIEEFRERVHEAVRVTIGSPIGRDVLDPLPGYAKAMMDFLRKATYELTPEPCRATDIGFELEEIYRA